MIGPFLTLALLVAVASGQNSIDTTVPIVRTVPGLRQFDYFSYSIVLHQLQANPSTREASLDSSRIVVSAPMYSVNQGSAVVNTGAVWSCPIEAGTSCSPIMGDNTDADRRLFDTDANLASENKTNQFLGASMDSNGDFFIVCAHRYQQNIGGSYLPRGRCYYSDRDLSGFSAHLPCNRFSNSDPQGSGVCTAGTGSVVTSSGSTNGVFGVGAPGTYLWRGAVTRLEESTDNFASTGSSNQDAFGLLGYSMVAGQFSTIGQLDYAVSNPRYSQRNYRGRVVIVANSRELTITNQPLDGFQMGEYYGFSLLAANLAGDAHDELIVSAPMYRSGTQPDTGRIFVYSNTNGALALVRTIVGRDAFSRFGHAMANLGDINGDGYDDIAVSAPYGEGSGSVYIYYSSPTATLSPNPAQVITGDLVNSNLLPSAARMNISGFGTSLASGVDVDGNTYNDLAVGTILSQQVYLLMTRPLAKVDVDFTANTFIVDLDNKTCNFRGTQYACFDVSVCVTYSGSGLNSPIDLTVTLVAERQNVQNNLEQRIFFEGDPGEFPNTYTEVLSASTSNQICFTTTAYVQNGITDRFNGFIIEAMITPPVLDPAPTNGSAGPMNFGGFPVISTRGTTTIQVETFKDCGSGSTCVPDLGVSVTDVLFSGMNGAVDALTVGAVNLVNISTMVMNNLDDAFQATLSIQYRTAELQFQRAYNNTINGQLTLTCTGTTQNEFTIQACNIGNPFNSEGSFRVNTLFAPRPELVGDEQSIEVLYSVTSVNEEDPNTLTDNMVNVPLTVNARANVFLDIPGIVFPESVSYSNVAPNLTGNLVTSLGPSVRTTFVVRNDGPSPVPTVRLTVMWPIDGPDAGLNTFIYPASISSMSPATVVCSNEFINTQDLMIPEDDNTEEEDQLAPAGKKRRRRRRSVPEVGRKVKRQATDNQDEETMETAVTQDREFSCADNAPTLNCVPITCDILGLRGGTNAQVEILSYVDERYFYTRIDRFTFVPTASVTVDAGHIETPVPEESQARILVIPASSINPETIVPPFPWYAVVFPIIAVIIIIAVVAVILYFCGFFRRAKHEEIKQKREELQNLADNGVTAEGGASEGTNL